jgi:periplasmic copper chaperone A
MRKIAMFVLAGMLLLSACGAPMSDAVEAKDAWARTGMMGGNSAAYMMLVNGTAQDDELIGASSDAADAVEIHLSQMGADNVMQMIKQESVQIPARKMLELKPGSYHVMMIGLEARFECWRQHYAYTSFQELWRCNFDRPCEGCGRYGRLRHGWS